MIKLTEEQQKVVNSDKNLVVIANPGSGKTATIAIKIKEELAKLQFYQGIIAISYTKKASKELKDRVLGYGIDTKRSFFGTIDKFCIEEVIIPFIGHIITRNDSSLEIFKIDDIVDFPHKDDEYKKIDDQDRINLSIEYIKKGILVLEDVGLLCNYIINESEACKRYLKSRYKYILIDEYQDCDKEQNEIFLSIKKLGIKAIAVGDVNQSIFEYANKYSKYLINLTKEDDFETIYMDKNFRCHESITRYAYMFLGLKVDNKMIVDNRVKKISVVGSEINIAKKIEINIDKIMNKYDVKYRSNIGILVRNKRTADIVSENLNLPHRVHKDTQLDLDSSNWAIIFKDLLNSIFNNQLNEYEFINKYFNYKYDLTSIDKFRSLFNLIKANIENDNVEVYFKSIAMLIDSENRSNEAVENLKNVLEDKSKLNLYKPIEQNEIQIMTLHKSKGLEFDIVFHLDLYDFILPKKKKVYGRWVLDNEQQCKNLHYVGITRAKKLCMLITSTKRTNFNGDVITAHKSEFLNFNN